MTRELRTTIEPSDIKALEIECLKCHARQTLRIGIMFNANGRCSNCGETWPINNVIAFQGLQKLISVLAEVSKINEESAIPFLIRFELLNDREVKA